MELNGNMVGWWLLFVDLLALALKITVGCLGRYWGAGMRVGVGAEVLHAFILYYFDLCDVVSWSGTAFADWSQISGFSHLFVYKKKLWRSIMLSVLAGMAAHEHSGNDE